VADYNKMNVDQLIKASLELKIKMAKLRDERKLIIEHIKKCNIEYNVDQVLSRFDSNEREVLRQKVTTVTPGPAILKAEGG